MLRKSVKSATSTKKNSEITSVLNGIDRTGQGLRDALFDEIDLIRTGNGDRRRAMAVAALAGRVMDTVKVEIEYAKQMSMASKTGAKGNILGALRLGRD